MRSDGCQTEDATEAQVERTGNEVEQSLSRSGEPSRERTVDYHRKSIKGRKFRILDEPELPSVTDGCSPWMRW